MSRGTHPDSKVDDARDDARTRRLTRIAIAVGFGSLAMSFVVGYFGYRTSRSSILRAIAAQNLSTSETIANAAIADLSLNQPPPDARDDELQAIRLAWDRFVPPITGSYMCVIERDGTLALHTLNPDMVGKHVGSVVVDGKARPRTRTVTDLLSDHASLAAQNRNARGIDQLAGYHYSEPLDCLVVTHVPLSLLEEQIRSATRPWLLSLATIAGILVPGALLLLHLSYTRAARLAQVNLHKLRRGERALRFQLSELDHIYDTSPVGLCFLDNNLRFVRVNDELARICGEPSGNCVGKPLSEVFPAVAEKVEQLYSRIDRGGESAEFEVERPTADAPRELRMFRIVLSPVTADGNTNGIAATFQDVTDATRSRDRLRSLNALLEDRVRERTTELEEARDRAEAADEAKSLFLTTMSHELRTPLNSILGFSGIMLQGLVGELNAEQRKQLGYVQNSGKHLLRLINDVLDVAAIEAGKLSLKLRTFEIGDPLRETADLIRPLATAKQLELECDFPDSLGSAVNDRGRLEQILLNLLSNAVKFTDEGRVSVKARRREDHLHIEVTDTGIGMARHDIESVFLPFTQLEPGMSRSHEGSGLGLTISARLTALMGGQISVESETGAGSVFKLKVPINVKAANGPRDRPRNEVQCS